VLALSFLALAWTGFALKYPDQWWARPLLLMEGRYAMRSLIHRLAAAVFLGISATHVASLIASRKLRAHWKEMLPSIEIRGRPFPTSPTTSGWVTSHRAALRTATWKRPNTGRWYGARW